jgi:hypothetical protein
MPLYQLRSGSLPLKRRLPGGDLRLGATIRFREALASPAF